MPSLGADMEAGTLVEWLVKPGDRVKRGDIVAVVETQKGAIEIEIFETGRIEQLLVDLDAKVPVGTPLARVLTDLEVASRQCDAPAPCRAIPPPTALDQPPASGSSRRTAGASAASGSRAGRRRPACAHRRRRDGLPR